MKTIPLIVRSACTTIILCVALAGPSGCSLPDEPAWDSPLDPYSQNYFMQFPILGTPAVNASRQVTVPVYAVDPYASVIYIERRNGSTGSFLQVGSVPASRQVFVDGVPSSEGPVVWYRVRLQAIGGALSPYSVATFVSIP